LFSKLRPDSNQFFLALPGSVFGLQIKRGCQKVNPSRFRLIGYVALFGWGD